MVKSKLNLILIVISFSCLNSLTHGKELETYDDEEALVNIECYKCSHDPSGGNNPRCDVEYRPGALFAEDHISSFKSQSHSLWEDEEEFAEYFREYIGEDEDGTSGSPNEIGDLFKIPGLVDYIMDGLQLNPCYVVSKRVLKMVEEEQLAFYNNIDSGQHHALDKPILKSEITAVQFQNRKNAIFAEVQMNRGIDVFTFYITDPVTRVLVPEDSWYYGKF